MTTIYREQLANLCHEQWSNWMVYLFSKGTFNEDFTWTMPEWAVHRWQKQMNTPYESLSEEEKDSDRAEADKFIELIMDGVAKRVFSAAFSIGYGTQGGPDDIEKEWERYLATVTESSND